eukprot:TRINITY_DN11456_c0_g1_i1.p1 TRINITY_DN11456_c0_g1~~TRINITY_DN11456_c0_g1_i1.p1  ORF type:complete len:280 (-),score=52.04 TRINITY_DN11456_c0_g1_i1:82-921(-)
MGDGLSKVGQSDVAWSRSGQCKDIIDRPTIGGMMPYVLGDNIRDTLIIFDWDDTLLCSSAINMRTWTKEQLFQLEETVRTVLCMSMQLGETLIVTNGNSNWVQESTRLFFPGLESTLNQLKVISARAQYEMHYPGDPFAWKREAFRELLSARVVGYGGFGADPLNLVVLGDSRAEIQAANEAREALGQGSLVKTIKFKEVPSATDLLGQLRRVLWHLGAIVAEERSSSHRLVSSPGNQAAWAVGWQLVESCTPQMRSVSTPWLSSENGLCPLSSVVAAA